MDLLNALVALTNFVIVPGLAYGSQLALGALGVTLIYGILRFSNFAHGRPFQNNPVWARYLPLNAGQHHPCPFQCRPDLGVAAIDIAAEFRTAFARHDRCPVDDVHRHLLLQIDLGFPAAVQDAVEEGLWILSLARQQRIGKLKRLRQTDTAMHSDVARTRFRGSRTSLYGPVPGVLSNHVAGNLSLF